MPDWFSNNYVQSILSGVAVLIIGGVLAFFWERIVAVSAFVWNHIRMGNRTETRDSAHSLDLRDSAHSLDLRFVEFFSVCAAQQQKDGWWLGQIQTQWNVTNVSKSGMAAHLLRARLAKPSLPDARPELAEARGDVIGVDIPPNRTKLIAIYFFLVLPPDKLKSLTLNIVVIDQLNNEHALDPIKVKPQIAQPPTEGQT